MLFWTYLALIVFIQRINKHEGTWLNQCERRSLSGFNKQLCSSICPCKGNFVCQPFSQRCIKGSVYRQRCHFMHPCIAGLSCHPGYQQCFHSPRRFHEPCSLGFGCSGHLSCHPGVQKCFHHPRLLLEPCSLGFPCRSGLSCHPGEQICYHSPRHHLEPCSLFFGCGAGLACQPGIQKCFHSPRSITEPCSAFFNCGRNLSCHPGIQRCFHSPRQEDEPCSAGFPCAIGLKCSECTPEAFTCQKAQVPLLTNEDYDRPYNKVAFLATHNSFSYGMKFAPWVRNQDKDLAKQLDDGVRGFMLDFHKGWGDDEVRLCHETCLWGGSENVLQDLVVIRRFLDRNPTEVITLILEDYIRNAKLLTKIFDEADISRHVLHFRYWGNETTNWPTLRQMRYLGRLVVFSSAGKMKFPYAAKRMWHYLRENRYGSKSKDMRVCKDRRESSMNSFNDHWTLVLINWFDTIPNALDPCLNDFDRIQMKLKLCINDFGALPNFLAVDYYDRGKHGGVFKAIEWLNARWRESAKLDATL